MSTPLEVSCGAGKRAVNGENGEEKRDKHKNTESSKTSISTEKTEKSGISESTVLDIAYIIKINSRISIIIEIRRDLFKKDIRNAE